MIRNIKAYQKIRIYEPSARVNLDNSITHNQLTKNNKYKKGGVIAMIERMLEPIYEASYVLFA